VLLGSSLEAQAKNTANGKLKTFGTVSERIRSEGQARVIIRFSDTKVNVGSKETRGKFAVNVEKRDKLLRTLGNNFDKSADLDIIDGFSGTITKKGLNALKNSGYDVEIYEDKTYHIANLNNLKTIHGQSNSQSNGGSGGNNFGITNLDITTSSIGANYSWNILNITGRNVTVAVIDTGIDYNHTDLGGCFGNGCRVKNGWDFYNNDSDPLDDNGHGTHVAGIIGANGSIRGVAPEVIFYALKVCDGTGTDCRGSYIIDALQWAINNSANIASMSIGGSYSSAEEGNTGRDPISIAVDNAVDAELPVVISAGNNNLPAISTIMVPSAASKAITVGASSDGGTPSQSDDSVSSISAHGPGAFGRLDPELVAPGMNVNSTNITIAHGGTDYAVLSGTSMAAPHVAGALALLLEQNRNLTPTQLRAIVMNAAYDLNTNIFVQGSGELNVMDSMMVRAYALVSASNTYNQAVTSDRWEFVALGTHAANITIFNNNNYNITLNASILNFTNLENNYQLNKSQLALPMEFSIENNSNYTFQINFTLINLSQDYATTYGSMIVFNVVENTGSENLTRTISIPVIVTIPLVNYGLIQRTMYYSGSGEDGDPSGDVLYYAYYNNRSNNVSFNINWSSSSNDLDLYVYNSTADRIDSQRSSGTTSEYSNIIDGDDFKWIRIHAYDFSGGTLDFSINATDKNNTPPRIINITNADGQKNFTASYGGASGGNITVKINFTDADGDFVTLQLNDTRYVLLNRSQNTSTTSYATYILYTNASLVGTHALKITLSDAYGGISTAEINMTVTSTISIMSHTPQNLTVVVRKNSTQDFTEFSNDSSGLNLSYYWLINNTVNATTQNFTFNSSLFNAQNYSVTFVASTNESNQSITWNVYIDSTGPAVAIQSPIGIKTLSSIDINFTAADALSPMGMCWYNINTSSQNSTLPSCTNTTASLANGAYRITLYANDSLGFINSVTSLFNVSDTTPPSMSNPSPSGSLSSSTTEVTLRITTDEDATCKYDDQDVSYGSMDNAFSNSVTNHSAVELVGAGTYVVYTRCRDINGNTNNDSATINFTVRAPTNNAVNNNEGTGGDSPAIPQSSALAYNARYVSAQNILSVRNTDAPNVDLTSLVAHIIGLQEHLFIVITQHTDTDYPVDTQSFTQTNALFRIFTITHENLSEDNITSAEILFRVPISWLDQYSLSPEDVWLYRYNPASGQWTQLDNTLITGSDDTYEYFNATSPGLSIFAIGAPLPTTNAPNTSNITSPPNTGFIASNDTINNTKNHTERTLQILGGDGSNASTSSPFKSPSFIIIIVVLMTVLLVGIIKSSHNKQLDYSQKVVRSKPHRLAGRDSQQMMYQTSNDSDSTKIDYGIENNGTNAHTPSTRDIISDLKEEYEMQGQKIKEFYTQELAKINSSQQDYSARRQKIKTQYQQEVQQLHKHFQEKMNAVRK
jgi:PGF-pre-PGF domain-containing protein